MIFVTVGTHEQPFDRLIKKIDLLVKCGEIKEEVVIQTGYCTYEPQYCTWKKLFSYREMQQYIKEARIVITHGGPASFIAPLQIGKTPIVVPRQFKFNEHVNDHQVKFAKEVAERLGTIIVVEDIDKLAEMIIDYEKVITNMNGSSASNNKKFNAELEKIVDEMFEGKK